MKKHPLSFYLLLSLNLKNIFFVIFFSYFHVVGHEKEKDQDSRFHFSFGKFTCHSRKGGFFQNNVLVLYDFFLEGENCCLEGEELRLYFQDKQKSSQGKSLETLEFFSSSFLPKIPKNLEEKSFFYSKISSPTLLAPDSHNPLPYFQQQCELLFSSFASPSSMVPAKFSAKGHIALRLSKNLFLFCHEIKGDLKKKIFKAQGAYGHSLDRLWTKQWWHLFKKPFFSKENRSFFKKEKYWKQGTSIFFLPEGPHKPKEKREVFLLSPQGCLWAKDLVFYQQEKTLLAKYPYAVFSQTLKKPEGTFQSYKVFSSQEALCFLREKKEKESTPPFDYVAFKGRGRYQDQQLKNSSSSQHRNSSFFKKKESEHLSTYEYCGASFILYCPLQKKILTLSSQKKQQLEKFLSLRNLYQELSPYRISILHHPHDALVLLWQDVFSGRYGYLKNFSLGHPKQSPLKTHYTQHQSKEHPHNSSRITPSSSTPYFLFAQGEKGKVQLPQGSLLLQGKAHVRFFLI